MTALTDWDLRCIADLERWIAQTEKLLAGTPTHPGGLYRALVGDARPRSRQSHLNDIAQWQADIRYIRANPGA